MNRTWFDRCYGELLKADAVQRDPRLKSLYEADEFGNYLNDTWTIERVGASWYIYKNGKNAGGPAELLRGYDSRDEAKEALNRWSRQSGQRVFVREAEDCHAQEAAGMLNTFSTKGSLNIPMKVEKVGSKYYVIYTSGAIVDWDLPPFGTYGEPLAAAKRLAAAEGVSVKEECAEVDESLGSLLDDSDFDKLIALHKAGEAYTSAGDQLRRILASKHGMSVDAVFAHADVRSGQRGTAA